MSDSEEKRGVGRPKKDPGKTKSKVIKMRADNETVERLNFVAKELNTTRSSALRTLIFEAENILKIR